MVHSGEASRLLGDLGEASVGRELDRAVVGILSCERGRRGGHLLDVSLSDSPGLLRKATKRGVAAAPLEGTDSSLWVRLLDVSVSDGLGRAKRKRCSAAVSLEGGKGESSLRVLECAPKNPRRNWMGLLDLGINFARSEAEAAEADTDLTGTSASSGLCARLSPRGLLDCQGGRCRA